MTITTTFVTAYIKIYENGADHKTIDERVGHFEYLCKTGVNVALFVSGEYLPALAPLLIKYPNVKLMNVINLSDTKAYAMLEPYKTSLPSCRNGGKDTFEFLTLMNCKTEFVNIVANSNPFNTPQFAWIDFNVFHVLGNVSIGSELLKNISVSKMIEGITMPGCWEPNRGQDYTNVINWRFCGGFYIGSIDDIRAFHALVTDNLRRIMDTNKVITWEVNIWAYLEKEGLLKINWFKGDHNDSLISIPRKLFSEYTHHCKPLIQFEGTETGKYHFPKLEGYYPTSNSYLDFQGKRYLLIRYVNYLLTPEGHYIINHPKRYLKTRNILSTLNDSFEIDTVNLLSDGVDLPTFSEDIQGLEDMRLYACNGEMRFIATQREYSPNIRSRMLRGTINLDTYTLGQPEVLEPPVDSACEKNWIPYTLLDYENIGDEQFIYTWGPLQIGKILSGKLSVTRTENTGRYFTRVRGSTVPVKKGADEYWTLVHFSDDNMPRNYYHFIIIFNAEGQIQKYSNTFVFCRHGIEYCIGMTFENESRLRFWISQHDRDPMWLSVNLSAFTFT